MRNYTVPHASRVSAILALILLIGIMTTVFVVNQKEPVEGSKEVTIEILYDNTSETVVLHTDREFLGDLLLDEQIVVGEEGPYGLFITEVDGRTADDTKQEWWCITKNGEQMYTSVSGEIIEDGNKYEITLMVGW